MQGTTIYDLLAPGDLVFDVGANIGDKAAQYLARGARVVCFEPQPNLAAHVRSRFPPERVAVEAVALGSEPGTLTLSVCDAAPPISTFSERWRTQGRFAANYTWNRAIPVPVETLDRAIERYGVPRFCKIDVEAFEPQVLAGLSTGIPLLSFECHDEMMAETTACLGRLASLGFDAYTVGIGEDPRFAVEWTSSGGVLDHLASVGSYFADIYARHPSAQASPRREASAR
jgi:FkbM family methyltransferase